MFTGERVTWAVAAQHPRLDEGSGDADVVKQTAVLTAGLQPRTCDQHLHTSLQHTKRPLMSLRLCLICGFCIHKWTSSLLQTSVY